MNNTNNVNNMNNMNNTKNNDNSVIDEELYSRQLYVLGHEAMKKMLNMTILIIGADGLGQEIAKNVILAGVNKVFIYDTTTVEERDLGAGFYFKTKDIGKTKAESVLDELKNINKYVKVEMTDKIDNDFLLKTNIVVSVNQTNSFNLEKNSILRKAGVKFVMANSRGFFSQLFVDYNHHLCMDKTGEALSHGMINSIIQEDTEANNQFLVHLADGSKHSMDEKDKIKLVGKYKTEFVEIEAEITSVINKQEFTIAKPLVLSAKHKEQEPSFYLKNSEIHFDFEQFKTPFEIVHNSLEECISDRNKIVKYEYTTEDDMHKMFLEDILKEDISTISFREEFKNSKNTLIAATCSVLGGFASQEIIKGATGKFVPLNQFFYHYTEGLYNKQGEKRTGENKRYEDLIKLIGAEDFKKLASSKIFLVGAGAIGCENMKNFVMTGLCKDGKLHVTDMDNIEKSNLNRQFLFKEKDVGMHKSSCACKNACSMNEDYEEERCISYTTAVKQETENVFSDTFFDKVDLVSNALDNIQARMYMDERCVSLKKPMVDAGTLGTKGHVQVVVPFQTESYGSSSDAEQDTIPLCTIRSFPNSIEHTIEWALAEFKNIFEGEDGEVSKEYTLDELVIYGLYLFNLYFNKTIAKQLSIHPPDHVTEEGLPFWLPPKKLPHPFVFDVEDQMHVDFVLTTVKILATECFEMRVTESEILSKIKNNASNTAYMKDEEMTVQIKNKVEFEKDSYHSNFIYSASNLRARNYDIKEQSKHHITGIAGKIIPAIATTTAMVSGLATLEIMKILLVKTAIKTVSWIGTPNVMQRRSH
ncbi:UBA1 [Ecytonucleospora hepatopenaei]|uniref:UBA1 n=1 Tax=Ecytonucleospora hepatopenaei TaxID=646526 RepID=A0A1W0E8Y9_9MICR|nr:UBA1 [Ecytonucleospora hepatopenaei]